MIASTAALVSCAYVDNYLDSVENLPGDIQLYVSRIRDIDVQYRGHLRDVDHYYELFKTLQQTSNENGTHRKARALNRIHNNLVQAQELNDEKMQLVQVLQELIDQKTRQLDIDQKNLNIKEEQHQHQQREPFHHQLQASGGTQEDLGIINVAPTPAKHAHTQSPARGIGSSTEQSSSMADGSALAGSGASSSSGGAGGSSPNSERSSVGNARLSGSSVSNGSNNVVSSNIAANESQRSTMKRSRRRNDTFSGNGSHNNMMNMEFVGNESGSANECIGMMGSGTSSERKNSTSSSTHKKGSQGSSSGLGISGGSSGGAANNAGKKKKRKARGAGTNNAQAAMQANARNDDDVPEPIDPDEPTYCVCNQISFGEMILCDNDLCPIEWFHFSCVSLVLKPKGKWYCPNCRGDRPNVMKPKSQFLKELERYNKEKEEKT